MDRQVLNPSCNIFYMWYILQQYCTVRCHKVIHLWKCKILETTINIKSLCKDIFHVYGWVSRHTKASCVYSACMCVRETSTDRHNPTHGLKNSYERIFPILQNVLQYIITIIKTHLRFKNSVTRKIQSK